MTHLLTALPCEAKPLVEHFRLKRRMQDTAFTVYEHTGSRLTLTVSGVGKTAMAAAVAYTHAVLGCHKQQVWLNVGVAGHPFHDLGKAFLAHKISDADSGHQAYPPMVFKASCPSEALISVAQVEERYQQAVLYDMEASAFWQTACRFSSGELIQCLKIVSDNRQQTVTAITPARVSAWIAAQLETLEALMQQQQTLAETFTESEPAQLQALLARWHFSVQQQQQLTQLLQRWAILSPERPLQLQQITGLANGKQVLGWLRHQLDTLAFQISS